MIFFAAIIFTFCAWAIFSHKFNDGIIAKHLLTFSAITSMLVIVDPVNVDAFMASLFLLLGAIGYWAIRRACHIRASMRRLHH